MLVRKTAIQHKIESDTHLPDITDEWIVCTTTNQLLWSHHSWCSTRCCGRIIFRDETEVCQCNLVSYSKKEIFRFDISVSNSLLIRAHLPFNSARLPRYDTPKLAPTRTFSEKCMKKF